MKKTTIAAIAAALLLAAVLCTAGCVTSDQIAGDWLSITDDAASVLHFEADETGVLAELAASETDELVYEASAETSFAWKKTGASEYQLTFSDEAAETVAADLAKGTLVFRGETYEKQPSGLSGTTVEPENPWWKEDSDIEGDAQSQVDENPGKQVSEDKVSASYPFLWG